MDYLKDTIIKAQSGNKECLEELINHYDGYIRKFIKIFHLNKMQEEEVYNSAIIGLLTALDKFNVSREVQLNTYATGFIKKEIVNFIKREILPSNSNFLYGKSKQEIQLLSLDATIDNGDDLTTVENSISLDSINENNLNEDSIFIDELLNTFKEKDWIKDIYLKDIPVSEISKREHLSESFIYRRRKEIFALIREEVSTNDIKLFN